MPLPKALPGLLMASFRGVGFYVTDTKTEVGRRVAQHYFPGQDFTAYDDQGAIPKKLKFNGLYIGDDYIEKGKQLERVFSQSGIGTFIHPWFGAQRSVVVEKASISFSDKELRLVRITATLQKAEDNLLNSLFNDIGLGTISRVINSAESLFTEGTSMFAAATSGVLSRIVADASFRVSDNLFNAIGALEGEGGHLLQQTMPHNRPQSSKSLSSFSHNITTALYDATIDNSLSAIAPAENAKPPKHPLAPIDGFQTSLVLVQSLTPDIATAPSNTDKALYAAVQGQLLAISAKLLTKVEVNNRHQAITMRTKITTALDSFNQSLEPLFASTLADNASRLTRAVIAMRLCVMQDINETIGRLSLTRVLALNNRQDAWHLANMLAAENPQRIGDFYQQIISRNDLSHPASITTKTIEVLE